MSVDRSSCSAREDPCDAKTMLSVQDPDIRDQQPVETVPNSLLPATQILKTFLVDPRNPLWQQ